MSGAQRDENSGRPPSRPMAGFQSFTDAGPSSCSKVFAAMDYQR
jgi:hypothetical protein